MGDWEQVFICPCGYEYYHYKYLSDNTYLTGICPKCAKECCYMKKRIRRWVKSKNSKPFRWWKPSTWFSEHEYEYKDKTNE